MKQELIFLPMLGQIVLVMLVYVVLSVRKRQELGKGGVDLKRTALDPKAWPESVVKASNNITNQFELPVLFLALCLILHQMQAVTTTVLVLAWVFVVSRYLHAFVHTTSNIIRFRLPLFLVGFVMVLVMTIMATWQLLSP